MTYEMYRYVFLGAAIACGVMLVVSIILFFALRIPKVISDLSGRTARKAIEDIRRQNEQSGDKSHTSSLVNQQREKLTDKITSSGRIVPRDASPFGIGAGTEKISTQELTPEALADETTILSQGNDTTLLTQENETTILGMGASETTLLQEPAVQTVQAVQQFEVEYEITFIHTNEVIA